MTIRPARRSEFAAAGGALVVDAYRTLGDSGDDFYEPVLRDVEGRSGSGIVLIAEEAGAILGCVTLSIGQTELSEVDDDDAATIRMIGVAPSARGRGLGETLVRHCIAAADEAGCRRVRLDTRTSMTSAQRLYERLRFRRDPEHDWPPAPGILLLAYVLDLPADADSNG